jgi:hypothetical protein
LATCGRRRSATSQPAPDAPRPALVGLVNAPLQWGGVTWGACVWDFLVNETPWRRNGILLYELFHGVQPQLGLTVPALASEHLDALDGHYWLRLEWRACAGVERVRRAAERRRPRRASIPAGAAGAAESERAVEITEGVAQYTATVLAASSTAEATASALDQLAGAEK